MSTSLAAVMAGSTHTSTSWLIPDAADWHDGEVMAWLTRGRGAQLRAPGSSRGRASTRGAHARRRRLAGASAYAGLRDGHSSDGGGRSGSRRAEPRHARRRRRLPRGKPRTVREPHSAARVHDGGCGRALGRVVTGAWSTPARSDARARCPMYRREPPSVRAGPRPAPAAGDGSDSGGSGNGRGRSRAASTAGRRALGEGAVPRRAPAAEPLRPCCCWTGMWACGRRRLPRSSAARRRPGRGAQRRAPQERRAWRLWWPPSNGGSRCGRRRPRRRDEDGGAASGHGVAARAAHATLARRRGVLGACSRVDAERLLPGSRCGDTRGSCGTVASWMLSSRRAHAPISRTPPARCGRGRRRRDRRSARHAALLAAARQPRPDLLHGVSRRAADINTGPAGGASTGDGSGGGPGGGTRLAAVVAAPALVGGPPTGTRGQRACGAPTPGHAPTPANGCRGGGRDLAAPESGRVRAPPRSRRRRLSGRRTDGCWGSPWTGRAPAAAWSASRPASRGRRGVQALHLKRHWPPL